jgi:hypothetical protein
MLLIIHFIFFYLSVELTLIVFIFANEPEIIFPKKQRLYVKIFNFRSKKSFLH